MVVLCQSLVPQEWPRLHASVPRVNLHGVDMSDHSPTSTTFRSPNDVSNALIVRWAFGRINAKDVDSLRSFWASDSTVHFPTGTCRGSDEIAGYFRPGLRRHRPANRIRGIRPFRHRRRKGRHQHCALRPNGVRPPDQVAAARRFDCGSRVEGGLQRQNPCRRYRSSPLARDHGLIIRWKLSANGSSPCGNRGGRDELGARGI